MVTKIRILKPVEVIMQVTTSSRLVILTPSSLNRDLDNPQELQVLCVHTDCPVERILNPNPPEGLEGTYQLVVTAGGARLRASERVWKRYENEGLVQFLEEET